MRLIEDVDHQLPYPPRACAVTNRAAGDFVDFNVVIDRPEATRLYLLKEVVEEAGRLVGMVPEREVSAIREAMAVLSAELDEVREQMSMYAEFEEKFGDRKVPA